MPKAGKFDYPAIDIGNAVDRLRRVYDNTGKHTVSRENAIEAMGLKVSGGRAIDVLASFDKYGIAETGGHVIRITELGLRILSSLAEEESKKYLDEAIARVGLFREVMEEFGPQPTYNDVRLFLQDTAKVEPEKVPMKAEEIARILARNATVLATTGTTLTAFQGERSRYPEVTQFSGDQHKGVVEIRPDEGKSYIIPLENISLAKSLILTILEELEKKRS